MLESLLILLATVDALLGRLGLWSCLLNCGVPSIALSVVGCLESVLLTVDLEGELVVRVLVEIGNVGKAHDFLRVALFGFGLGHVEKTLAGVGGPGSILLRDLWLGTAEVVAQLLVRDGLVAEPEETFGELELARRCKPDGFVDWGSGQLTSRGLEPCSQGHPQRQSRDL